MKIKDGFIKRKIGEKVIVVPIGNCSREINGIIELNSTASFLWDLLKKEISQSEILYNLQKKYNISLDTAKEAHSLFMEFLNNNDLLER